MAKRPYRLFVQYTWQSDDDQMHCYGTYATHERAAQAGESAKQDKGLGRVRHYSVEGPNTERVDIWTWSRARRNPR